MAFTDIFIKRPVLAICVNLLLLLAGIKAYYAVSVRQYPKSDIASVIVTTAYVGADAELVRGFVTTPLERVIASADGIDYLESKSEQEISTITARLKLNYNIFDALSQIQSKIAQVRNELPTEAEAPVINVENADNQFALLYLSFSSTTLKENQITDYLMRIVQPRLSSIDGVQKADILGGRQIAMRIWLDSQKLAAHQISPSDLRRALLKNNYLATIGQTKGETVAVNLKASSDLRSLSEFNDLIVKQDAGRIVRLGDLAEVELGAENYDSDVRFDGKAATFIGVWALPGANSLDVIKRVRAELPEIEKTLPTAIELGVPYDATEYIENALDEVFTTLLETLTIVIVVIFLFIGSFRSILIPLTAIPLSLLGGVAIMATAGFSLNLLTLLAIVLAVGLVVDDAIVVLENIERHIRLGQAPLEAAIEATRELVWPIIVMTTTLAAVYAPIALQGGLAGTLFKEFVFTLAGAVLISGFVALTLSPMMSAKLITHNLDHQTVLKVRLEKYLNLFSTGYIKLLENGLAHYKTLILFGVMFAGLLPVLYMFSIKELAPREDQGIVFGIVQADPHAVIEQTANFSVAVQKTFESAEEYKQSFQLITPNGGFAGILLKPWSERRRSAEIISADLWQKMSSIAGLRVIVTTPPPLPGGGNFPIEFVLSSTAEPIEMAHFGELLVGAAFASGRYMFAESDLKFDLPQSEFIFDREKIAAFGLNLQDIAFDLATLTGGNYINRFSLMGRSYKIITQLKRELRLNPEQILESFISGPNSQPIQLSSVAQLQNRSAPRSLNRFQQLNSIKIQGAYPPNVSADQALSVLEEQAAKILPGGYSIDYAGEARQLRKEQNSLTMTIFFAAIMIYLLLAAQFESFRDPFIILAGSVPLALTGALIFVFLGLTTLNIYSQVGIITLVGLVAKNGILIVEFANQLHKDGIEKKNAILQASLTRLRPVLMTSIATIAGHFPLILASGPGAGARNSIGWVLVTGMFIGTIFTLFFVPAIYLVLSKK
ncbi:MAG TPA: efflux RND transporter permease subunit [Oligoflexia bacterium]|nr:efflux RND transporter permease subunit [Oligoflexia bacterium]HMP27921.1 efflux RND transporter permease subunit [Oligoflexia bacterium]